MICWNQGEYAQRTPGVNNSEHILPANRVRLLAKNKKEAKHDTQNFLLVDIEQGEQRNLCGGFTETNSLSMSFK